jgi:hypothetical protein
MRSAHVTCELIQMCRNVVKLAGLGLRRSVNV